MGSIAVLAALAARLNREAGSPQIPSLYFFTDPARTPDPTKIAALLPAGAAVVFRHFGMPKRLTMARKLKQVADARGLVLLIGADPELARQVGADGIHWPERLAPSTRAGFALETMAAHSARAVQRAARFDACILSPVFESASASARAPLGVQRASAIARQSETPVIALGGITATNARRLSGRSFAGVAAVDAFLEA